MVSAGFSSPTPPPGRVTASATTPWHSLRSSASSSWQICRRRICSYREGRKKSGKVWRLQKNSVYLQADLRLKTKIMTDNVLFTRETFLAAMRREKKRKQEWEDKMNKKLDDLQEQIKLVNDSHLYDLA